MKNIKKIERILLISSVVLLATFMISCGSSRVGKGKKDDNVIQLFNGKDLDGWYTFIRDRGKNSDPKNVFTVEDGMIHISGEEWGCITTEEEYENYHLITEFKWGGGTYEPRLDRARDCGILLHSKDENGGYNGIWMYSIECQIIEGGSGDFLVVGDKTDKYAITCPVAPEKQGSSHVFDPEGERVTINSGRINWYGRDPEWKDVIDFRGEQDVERPVGEWNTMECIAKGDSITIKLNGVVVNQAFNVKPSKGFIQVQSEGAEILFRKIELRKL